MQIYCVEMAPELCVIMCESNNPVRYVRQESMNTKKAPALNSCVLEICRHARCGRISIPETLSFWPNLSNLVHSRALYSHRGALCVPPILSFLLHQISFSWHFHWSHTDVTERWSISNLHFNLLFDFSFGIKLSFKSSVGIKTRSLSCHTEKSRFWILYRIRWDLMEEASDEKNKLKIKIMWKYHIVFLFLVFHSRT